MKKNMGTLDRAVRVLIALAALGAWYTGAVTGYVAIVAVLVAVVFMATSAVAFCPLYRLVGLSTCPAD